MHAVRMPVPDSPGLALLLTVALLALVLALDVPSLSAQKLFSGIPFGDPGLLGLAMTGGVGAAGGVFYLSASSAVYHAVSEAISRRRPRCSCEEREPR